MIVGVGGGGGEGENGLFSRSLVPYLEHLVECSFLSVSVHCTQL